jgi:hypothetical protein
VIYERREPGKEWEPVSRRDAIAYISNHFRKAKSYIDQLESGETVKLRDGTEYRRKPDDKS